MTLNKRILRGISQKKIFYIGSILLCTFTTAFIIAAVSTGQTMKKAVDRFYREYNVEDAHLTLAKPLSSDEINGLEEKYHIDMEEIRYVEEAVNDTTLRIFRSTDTVNRAQILTGRDIDKESEIIISNDYAVANGYNVGDTINIDDNEFTIVGFFTRPDYTYMLKSLNDSYINSEKFGIAQVNDISFRMLGEGSYYYAVCYTENNSLALRQELNEKYKLINYVTAKQNYRISYAANQGDAIVGMALTFSPIFFALTMGIIAVTLSRMVGSDRKIIGVLFAQGYKRSQIVSYYARYTLPISFAGSLFGIIFGLILLNPFFALYRSDFNFPVYELKVSVQSVAAVIILPLFLFFSVAALVVYRMLKYNAIQLLRGIRTERVKPGSRLFRNSGLSNSFKYSVRNVMRNKGRSLVLILGVLMSSVFIVIGFIMRSSCLNIINKELAATKSYNYTYYYLSDRKSEIPENALPFYRAGFEVKDSDVTFQLIGIDFDSEIFPMETVEGKDLDKNKVYISRSLSELLKIGPGDYITFTHPISLKEYTCRIEGVAAVITQKAIYMTLHEANRFIGVEEGTYNGLYSVNKLDINPELLSLTKEGEEEIEIFKKLLEPVMTVDMIPRK